MPTNIFDNPAALLSIYYLEPHSYFARLQRSIKGGTLGFLLARASACGEKVRAQIITPKLHHSYTLRFFFKFVSLANCSKTYRPIETPRKEKKLRANFFVFWVTKLAIWTICPWNKFEKRSVILFRRTLRHLQIAYEGDFQCLCTLTLWIFFLF